MSDTDDALRLAAEGGDAEAMCTYARRLQAQSLELEDQGREVSLDGDDVDDVLGAPASSRSSRRMPSAPCAFSAASPRD